MYYDRLRQRVHDMTVIKRLQSIDRVDAADCIAPCYLPVHKEVQEGPHNIFYLPGGRGSAKSSFVSIEMVNGVMNDPDSNGIVFRRTASTMRDSVYAQIGWAIAELGVGGLWRGSVSPMQYTYTPTGQQIIFRGLDDVMKLKSVRAKHGAFKFVWFEEFSELTGPNMVRSVLQSVVRGSDGFRIFASFNPPLSINSWANKYILVPDDRALVFRTTYKMIPPEWLGSEFLAEAKRLAEINPQAYKHEYEGIATGSGGEVFPTLRAQTITDDDIAQMDYFYCGLDFGFSVDPLAFIRCSYNRKTDTVYLLDELYLRNCSNQHAAELIQEHRYDHPGTYWHDIDGSVYERSQTIICDSAEPKSISDLQRLGLKATACKKYPGSVLYGIRWLQHRKIVIDPKRTPNAWREFSEYEYTQTKDGEFLADVPDANNHCIDATRYALDHVISSSKYSA